MTPERKAELRALAGPSEEQWLELLDALDAAERRAEEAERRVCGECGALTKPCREWHGPVELAKRAEEAERRLHRSVDETIDAGHEAQANEAERDELADAVEALMVRVRENWGDDLPAEFRRVSDALAKLPLRMAP